MRKLLIACESEEFVDAITRQLKGAYMIESCSEADRVLERIDSFQPEILLLDLMLKGGDGMWLLRTLRTSGCSTQVVVITACNQPHVMNSLEQLRVSAIFMKPCKASEVAACIYALSAGAADNAAWFVESEVDLILLQLSFRMGPARYSCVYHAILTRYHSPQSYITKQLYPEVAYICGGTAVRVEKAIRDAIHEAWRIGDKQVWQMYFPPGKGGVMTCPSNEEFVSRIAAALHHRARLCAPGKLPDRIAK